MENPVKTMETPQQPDIEFDIYDKLKNNQDLMKLKQLSQDQQMTSSTISSLASPGDSGVQLLDSESDITSMISCNGMGCSNSNSDNEITIRTDDNHENGGIEGKTNIMTKSDIVNQNVTHNHEGGLSKSVPNYFDRFEHKFEAEGVRVLQTSDKKSKEMFNHSLSDEVFEMEHPIKNLKEKHDTDSMNISLNSYELLDYTLQNKNIIIDSVNEEMHVSMSEEVNENLTVNHEQQQQQPPTPEVLPIVENVPENVTKPVEDQIVFRRQRKKKSKSDTPKKRVSFHEDILNSTKIDDIHIDHGFITHEPDVSLSFFQRTFIRKPDVVKGRYSWAAEGDAPYYEKSNNREIKSDIYINCNNSRLSSTSSSSSNGSLSSSSIDEDDENFVKKEPTFKQPKSSCLKKTSSRSKKIDTNIVEEEIKKRKKTDTNLLDSNIFGSLKNILSFSTSVPLAERGVPEGQEDFTIYSTSHDSFTNNKPFIDRRSLKNPKAYNLKLTTSEGFYPNYPKPNQNLPTNIILCDSNVYEHKGISYSYEYDKFQKTFEKNCNQEKPKSSTIYQMIVNELNFWRKKSKQDTKDDDSSIINDFEVIPSNSATDHQQQQQPQQQDSIEEVEEIDIKSPKNTVNKYATTIKMDWSDNETISDLSTTTTTTNEQQSNSRHLNSPKKKINKSNHYSLSPFKITNFNERNDDKATTTGGLTTCTSRSSLINRFLRNVTLKKMLEIKAQCRQKDSHKYLELYVKGLKYVYKKQDDYDRCLEQEILQGKENQKIDTFDKKVTIQLKKEIFRNRLERLLGTFPVRSAYTTNGNSKALLVILTDTTLYIVGFKSTLYCNHFVLPYTELNTILIGPNSQTIHFSNYDKDMQCLITTGCSKITNSLVGQLEYAMRRDLNKPNLPAVKQLCMRDMMNLRRAICKQTSVDKDEEYYYYSIVNIQDFNPDAIDITPLGPNKEGPLMFKTSDVESRWETAYFILKAGVLYMLSSASQRVPMRVFPLINGSCQGARRIYNYPRPHTFQLTIENQILHLAAPDEYVASDWLQCLVHAASGAYNNRERILTQSCSLFMTTEHILTVREAFPCTIPSLLPHGKNQHEPIKGAQVLSCAAIVDLVSFRLPSAEQSWCVLEFACREVHECSGDWILYFATNNELEYFISTLEILWSYTCENGDSFPLSTIPETDPLSKKCVDIYMSLKNSWPSTSTVHLQFL